MRKDSETGRSLAMVGLQTLRDLVIREIRSCDHPGDAGDGLG